MFLGAARLIEHLVVLKQTDNNVGMAPHRARGISIQKIVEAIQISSCLLQIVPLNRPTNVTGDGSSIFILVRPSGYWRGLSIEWTDLKKKSYRRSIETWDMSVSYRYERVPNMCIWAGDYLTGCRSVCYVLYQPPCSKESSRVWLRKYPTLHTSHNKRKSDKDDETEEARTQVRTRAHAHAHTHAPFISCRERESRERTSKLSESRRTICHQKHNRDISQPHIRYRNILYALEIIQHQADAVQTHGDGIMCARDIAHTKRHH